VIRLPSPVLAGLPAGVVDTWCVPLHPESAALARWRMTLSHDERAQAARMRVTGAAWAAARGALRTILGYYLAETPESLRFAASPLGKPSLSGRAAPHFSVAWREDLALVGVASDREVGVDLEREREDADVSAIARDFLSPLEQAAIDQAPSERRRIGVLRGVGPARGPAEAVRPRARGSAAGGRDGFGRDRARAQCARGLDRRGGRRGRRLAGAPARRRRAALSRAS
jgi:4'-phosphopantetheinyl transferase